ncbi:MAG: transcriptional regulator [Betaproteobacteria bacterium HGW-Betaproteobacteria-10]|nr:MAG: transcriptional regulator [Betaproteobacteria bacterium HGW-Betaproteobacteria-10]
MSEKVEFSQRLKQAIGDAGYSLRPIVLEREFNTRYWGRPITVQAVRRWLNGEAIPSQDKLQVLADWLKIEPQILRFGGEALLSVQEKKKRWEDAVAGPEREVLEAFLSLPAAQKKVAREVILALAKAAS